MPEVQRALVSVSDKRGVVEFARGLAELGIEILSTGGTATALAQAGVPVVQVGDYTGFPEMLDGRVKTLHPKIHGGLLGRRDLPAHTAAMREHGIEPIDLVAVNLYPFRETVAKPGTTLEEAIEQIDIGGPSMLRSAAKNHASVTVLVDPDDYAAVLAELDAAGDTTAATRRRLAQKVFCATACYDGAIADYLGRLDGERGFGQTFHWGGGKALDMRYGENPHQGAALYGDFLRVAEPLHGKELSYNNVVDIDAALALADEFREGPAAAVAILKHNTPCGVGLGRDPLEAWQRALATDPESPFGGIVVSVISSAVQVPTSIAADGWRRRRGARAARAVKARGAVQCRAVGNTTTRPSGAIRSSARARSSTGWRRSSELASQRADVPRGTSRSAAVTSGRPA